MIMVIERVEQVKKRNSLVRPAAAEERTGNGFGIWGGGLWSRATVVFCDHKRCLLSNQECCLAAC